MHFSDYSKYPVPKMVFGTNVTAKYNFYLKIWLIMADFFESLQKWLILKTGEGIELGKCATHQ